MYLADRVLLSIVPGTYFDASENYLLRGKLLGKLQEARDHVLGKYTNIMPRRSYATPSPQHADAKDGASHKSDLLHKPFLQA